MIRPEALSLFLEVIEAGSIQAAARRFGRSRATYQRALDQLAEALGGVELVDRRPGQRQAIPTRAGARLEARARAILGTWGRWQTETVREVGRSERQVRVGALAGAFDLLAELVQADPDADRFVLVEYPAERLPDAVAKGDVDLAVGTPPSGAGLPDLDFDPIGPLPWSVILPSRLAGGFGPELGLIDLHEIPMVVPRTGPARSLLDRCFETHPAGPLTLRVAVEVESTPRMVDMVAKGFGPAVVTQFRLQYLPERVEVRRLVDGPPPLVAGVYSRVGDVLPAPAERLVGEVRAALEAVTQIA